MNIEHQSEFNPYIIEVLYINEKNVPYPVGTHFEKRIVRFYELELITGGSGTIITNGEVSNVSKGDIFLRTPGTIVEGYSGYYFIVIAFDVKYEESRKNLYATLDPYWVQNEREMLCDAGFFKDVPYKLKTFSYELEGLFLTMFNEFVKNRQDCQLVLKACLFSIFNNLLFSPKIIINNIINVRSFINNYDIIKSSQDYIDNNFNKDLTLSELSDMCHLSKNFYCKIFKHIIGLSPFEYIIQNRANAAKKLLVTTNIQISDISLMCGFNDITYFYKFFKKQVNMTPADFRKRYSFGKSNYKS